MNPVAIGPLVKSIAPPDGGVWIRTSAVPAAVWSAPWMTMTAQSGSQHTTFSYRKAIVGHQTYLQIYANEQYLNFINGAFTATSLAGIGGVGLGDLTDSTLQAAATALLADLNSSGCQQGVDATVQAFQQAYVNAGGSLPNDSNGSSGIDGLYGANTQAALQATLNAGPNGATAAGAAPAGCVAAASGGAAAATPDQIAAAGVTSGLSTTTWVLIGAGVVGAGIIGYALLHKKKTRVVHLRTV